MTKATRCDWVLVAPGVYPGSVVIRTPDLHLRGLDRNRVVIDGRHRKGVNGIAVRTGDVWVENLTVRNFDRTTPNAEHGGNEVWWYEAHGWHGNYLTVYDTGLLGGYGLFAERAEGGEWDHVYATGFDDSGLYIGACRDCEATVSHALAERNPVGYAGTNSGGHLVLEDSLFRNNAVGLSLNSSESDPPPPQLGTCAANTNRSATPTITSTALSRCTLIRGNRIVANNNLSVPANTSSERPGWGIGIVLLGAYGDLVTKNVLADNRTVGVLGLEFPGGAGRGGRRFTSNSPATASSGTRPRASGSSLWSRSSTANSCPDAPTASPSRRRNRRCRTRARERRATRSVRADGMSSLRSLSATEPVAPQPRRRTSEHGPQSRLSIASGWRDRVRAQP